MKKHLQWTVLFLLFFVSCKLNDRQKDEQLLWIFLLKTFLNTNFLHILLLHFQPTIEEHNVKMKESRFPWNLIFRTICFFKNPTGLPILWKHCRKIQSSLDLCQKLGGLYNMLLVCCLTVYAGTRKLIQLSLQCVFSLYSLFLRLEWGSRWWWWRASIRHVSQGL